MECKYSSVCPSASQLAAADCGDVRELGMCQLNSGLEDIAWQQRAVKDLELRGAADGVGWDWRRGSWGDLFTPYGSLKGGCAAVAAIG